MACFSNEAIPPELRSPLAQEAPRPRMGLACPSPTDRPTKLDLQSNGLLFPIWQHLALLGPGLGMPFPHPHHPSPLAGLRSPRPPYEEVLIRLCLFLFSLFASSPCSTV